MGEGVARSTRRRRKRCAFETLEPRWALALTVLNANDSGSGSLRQAILDADDLSGSPQTINFALPTGQQAIDLISPLPEAAVTTVLNLDATQNVTVVSPANGAQDNLNSLAKTGGGTLTLAGLNNLTGNIQVDGGSLQLDAGDLPSNSSQPFGPAQGVDGEPLADLWPYGGMVANGNLFARSPVLFTTQAGTVLAMARYQANSQDNSGDNNIFVRRSYDGGKTFDPATIISPPPLPGDAALLASWGGTSWALDASGPDLVQRQDGTIYLFYNQTRNGNPQAVAQRQYVFRYMTSKDDGLTWSAPTDITAATIFAGNQNVATITAVSDPTPGVVRLGLTFKTSFGKLPAARSLIKISGLVNDPMGLNGNSYWISNVVSNTTGFSAVIELAGTPAWQDGTAVGAGSVVTPQSVWLGTVGAGEPILRSGRIVIPMYYRYDTSGSGFEPFVGCVYSDDGKTFSQGMLADETQTAIYNAGGMLEPHFTELSADNHLYISCNTKGAYHGHMTSTDGGQTWTFGLDDGTAGSTLLKVVSTPAPVIAIGGGKYVMVLPDNNSHRLRLTAFLSADECKTWTQQIPLFSGTAWYSDLCLSSGNIVCAYERGFTDTDFNYQGIVGNTTGQIGLVTFNLAAIRAGITDQVLYDFNELPAGQNAWARSASIIDSGTGDHRATTLGSPTYAAAPSGTGQSALTFHPGDALLLANQVDPTFDPDYLATDNGGVTLEFGYAIANHGYGALFGGDSGVGSGTKGITVVVNPNGTVSMTVDDGLHHATITSTVDATNDGAYHRVVCERDVASGRLRMWIYRADGSPTEVVASVVDPTSLATGSLWNPNDPTYLCRYGNTTSGSMSQNITFDFFGYTKKALTPDRFAPIPLVARPPEQFPRPGAATPDTVAPANLQLWLFDSRGGYSMRTNRGSSPTPNNPPPGYAADYLLDSSGHGYYTTFSDTSEWYGVDPNVGGYWTVPGQLAATTLDQSTIGKFNYISQFSSAWTIAGMFRIPSASIDKGEVLLSDGDGTNGFEIGTGGSGSRKLWFSAQNEHGSFLISADPNSVAYSADTWYYFALEFDGNGGPGAQGLTAYLVPLTAGTLTESDVAAHKGTILPNDVDFGSTAAAMAGSSAALKIAGGAGSETQMADIAVWNTALSDANILTLANGLMSKPTATIDGNGSLELAGPDPFIGSGHQAMNVVNNSTAANGLLISGRNEIVAGIDGSGNTVVNAGGQLTADHIVQGSLVIGGAAGSPATVTIAASNSAGNPSGNSTAFNGAAAIGGANSATPADGSEQGQSVARGAQIRPLDSANASPSLQPPASLAENVADQFDAAAISCDQIIAGSAPEMSDELPTPQNSGKLDAEILTLTRATDTQRQAAVFGELEDAALPVPTTFASAIDAILANSDLSSTLAEEATDMLVPCLNSSFKRFAI